MCGPGVQHGRVHMDGQELPLYLNSGFSLGSSPAIVFFMFYSFSFMTTS